jgi:hypothetical protein
MRPINAFIDRTVKWFLLLSGLVTCATLPLALDIGAIGSLLGGFVDYTPSSVPALRHWGFMVFCIGVLMVLAAFRPWLRFEVMLFSTVEKAFIIYLFLTSLGEPWVAGYFPLFVVDAAIVAYSIVYFISERGRPGRWAAAGGTPVA